MKIVALSDTHGQHRKIKIPKGNILIHAGDFTGRGEISVTKDFVKWFSSQPHKYKILIAGNHELGFSNPNDIAKEYVLSCSNITYLENSHVVIDGIKIWGSPISPRFFDWEFNVDRGKPIRKYWDLIPSDTDILITHGPPMNVLDLSSNRVHCGCEELEAKYKLKSFQPKLHIFGHIHHDYGIVKKWNTTFVNASVLDDRYQLRNSPVIIDYEKEIFTN